MARAITFENLDPPADAGIGEGIRLLASGLRRSAEAICRRILASDPDHVDGLNLMGLIARDAGDGALAIDILTRAVATHPAAAHLRNNLANALQEAGRPDEAVDHYRIALRLDPGAAVIHNNLAAALRVLGRLDEAASHYRLALHIAPDTAVVHCNLGSTLRDMGCPREAESCFRMAAHLDPQLADAHVNLANLMADSGRPEAAEPAYRTALQLRPRDPECLNNLGSLLLGLGRLAEAEQAYAAALRIRPDYAEAYYNLGCALLAQNRLDAARVCYGQALVHKPDYGAARFALCMAELPVLYATTDEIGRRREAYEGALRRLAATVAQEPVPAGLAAGVGASPPFFLAYQGQDDRVLQALHGGLASRLVAAAAPARPRVRIPGPREPVRVGIVTGFFQTHTVWSLLVRGWLKRLDRDRFELIGYHTGSRDDAATAEARSLCDRFHAGRATPERWGDRIVGDAPHVLLYPEIGIDPMAARLAAERLAPVQCAAWGHPVTSGLPTIDYFLSSDLMEPADADAHYTERLVRLPNLGTWYHPAGASPLPLSRRDIGLRDGAVVYWSGQALFKYLPQFDEVFPRIAAAVGDCQFVFIEFAQSEQVTDLFRRRLHGAFAAAGLDAGRHCVLLPSLEHHRFLAAAGLCDGVLDTIGWSGGKSTLDCLTQDLPLVTLRGALMRGRHGAAILERLGLRQTIADSVDAYVELAVRLARDAGWRTELRRATAARKARLYRDDAPIEALADVLDQAARLRRRGRRSAA